MTPTQEQIDRSASAEQQLAALQSVAVRDGSAIYQLKDGRTLKVATRRLRITHILKDSKYEPVPEGPQYIYKATRNEQVDYLAREQVLRLLEVEA